MFKTLGEIKDMENAIELCKSNLNSDIANTLETLKERWLELKERLEKADYEIWKLVDHNTTNEEMIRLKGKHEGIKVALSYLEGL